MQLRPATPCNGLSACQRAFSLAKTRNRGLLPEMIEIQWLDQINIGNHMRKKRIDRSRTYLAGANFVKADNIAYKRAFCPRVTKIERRHSF